MDKAGFHGQENSWAAELTEKMNILNNIVKAPTEVSALKEVLDRSWQPASPSTNAVKLAASSEMAVKPSLDFNVCDGTSYGALFSK